MFASGPVRPAWGPSAVRWTGCWPGSGDVGRRGTVQHHRAIAGQMDDFLPGGDGHGEAGKTVIRDAGV